MKNNRNSSADVASQDSVEKIESPDETKAQSTPSRTEKPRSRSVIEKMEEVNKSSIPTAQPSVPSPTQSEKKERSTTQREQRSEPREGDVRYHQRQQHVSSTAHPQEKDRLPRERRVLTELSLADLVASARRLGITGAALMK